MNKSTIIHIGLILLFVTLFAGTDYAQDDPNIDNTIHLSTPEYIQPSSPLGRDILTSEEGFDNFLIGVDFAEPHISANPNNPTEYFNAFNTNATHYTYDGVEWFFQVPNFGFSMNGDPVTAYDSLGNLYYENMYNTGGGIVGCKVIVSTDNGATWSSAVTSILGNDKNWIAADQTSGPYANYVYTTMTQGSGHAIARSTNFGATWTQTGFYASSPRPGAMVAVGPNVIGGDVPGGAVYFVTNHTSTFAPLYSFYLSTNGGANWVLKSTQQFANYVGTNVNGRHSVENMRTRPYPFITADNSYGSYRGRLYLVYASNTPAGDGNKPDIFCRYSTDQGASWSSPVVINDDPNTTENHQWMPAVWCDKETGRLYAKWFDTRNVPSSDSAEVYASYSDDGGTTWAVNQNLSTSKFKIDCSTCGGGGTPRYLGDYDAITSNSVTSMAVWSDFRSGNFGSFVAYFPDFAMLVTEEADTVNPDGTAEITLTVPAVKLYDNTVKFTAESVPAGNFIFEFPQGDSLTTYPDSLQLNIVANNSPEGSYTIRIFGRGPNGTPAHERNLELLVTNPTVNVVQPNGGDVLYVNTLYPIVWEKIFVDQVKLEYSTDNGSSWILIADGVDNSVSNNSDSPNGFNQYDWVVPNTVSSNCLVRISDSADPLVFGVSESTFSIEVGPSPSWIGQVSGVSTPVECVDLIDTLIAWAGTFDGKTLRTTNGGVSWQTTAGSPGAVISSISGIDDKKAFVTVNTGSAAQIKRTVFSGINWATVYENTDPAAKLNSVVMLDDQIGYAIGDPIGGQWLILKTTDGGTNWDDISTLPQNGTEKGLSNSVVWLDVMNGWFGTDDSRVYRTTDGGVTWSSSSTTFQTGSGLTFTDMDNGAVAGEDINWTTDGGNTWFTQAGQISGEINSAASAGMNYFFATGTEVYLTNDFGNTYTLNYTQADTLRSIDIDLIKVGENFWITGYAVGNNGTIAKYKELSLVTEIESEESYIPETFSLEQNYPNPFNPSTSIEFSIPVASNVELTIFNILGQKVATLISEQRPAGYHSVLWNAANSDGLRISSGIFFYHLKATGVDGSEFQQTRKMVLLK